MSRRRMSSRTFSVLVGLAVGVAVVTVMLLVDEETRSWIRAVAGAAWVAAGATWLAGKLYDRFFPRPE